MPQRVLITAQVQYKIHDLLCNRNLVNASVVCCAARLRDGLDATEATQRPEDPPPTTAEPGFGSLSRRSASGAETGFEKKNPWPNSHPMDIRRVICSCCSTPSATTSIPSVCAMSRIDFHDLHIAVSAPQLQGERPVDLQRVEGKLRQVREAGITSSEVVDFQADSQTLQARQDVAGRLVIVHEDAFGDLQPQTGWLQPGFLQYLRNLLHQLRFRKLARREIHADGQGWVGLGYCDVPLFIWEQAWRRTHMSSAWITPISSATGINSTGGIEPRCG